MWMRLGGSRGAVYPIYPPNFRHPHAAFAKFKPSPTGSSFRGRVSGTRNPEMGSWRISALADAAFVNHRYDPNPSIPVLAARSRNDDPRVIHMSGYSNPLKSLHLKKIMCHFIHASPRPAIILPRVPSGNALPVRPVWREGTGSAGTGLTEPGPAAGTGSPKSCGG